MFPSSFVILCLKVALPLSEYEGGPGSMKYSESSASRCDNTERILQAFSYQSWFALGDHYSSISISCTQKTSVIVTVK